VLTHRAWALDGPDDVDDTLAVAAEVLGIGAGQGDPELRLEGLRIRVAAQFENGQYPAAVLTALTMKELAEQVGHPEFIRLATMWDVTVANLEGRFDDAKQLADELARRLARLGHSQAGLIPIVQVFPWGLLRGAAARLLPTLQELSAYEPASAVLPAITAWCLAEAGDTDDAAALLARTDPAAAAAADKNYLWWAVQVGFAGTVDLTGDQRWAEALYQLIAPYAGHNATLGVATFLGAADHWLGVLAAAAGRLDQSAGHLETALARHQEMGSRPLTALTEEVYGHVLSRRGNPGDAERARAFTTSATVTARELALPAILNRPRLRALPLVEEGRDGRVHVDRGALADHGVQVRVTG
jgi:ATP/maltotriose-dependent transcriptional regulator MalT